MIDPTIQNFLSFKTCSVFIRFLLTFSTSVMDFDVFVSPRTRISKNRALHWYDTLIFVATSGLHGS